MSRRPIQVEAQAYVPFEPRTDALRDLRSELRSRLRELAAQEDEVLGARFYGLLPRGVDVENALLYNIDTGGATFAAAARCGVRFEHDRSPLPSGGVRYEYDLEGRDAGLALWEASRTLATIEVELAEAPTLAGIWWALREQRQIAIDTSGRGADEPFAVSLLVSGPARSARPELVKRLIDGVVCALQSQTDPEAADAAAPLIASALGVPSERVRAHLLDDSASILGTRARLVHQRSAGVQWAPDDDKCVAGEVLLSPSESWSISGRVLAVTPRRSSTGEPGGYGRSMNSIQATLAATSKALREAAFAFERHMLGVDADELPTQASHAVNVAVESLSAALAAVEAQRN